MVGWETVDGGIQVSDAGDSLSLRAPDLRGVSAGATLPRAVDAALECTASKLQFPRADGARLRTADGSAIEGTDRSTDLPTGEYVLDVSASIPTLVQFVGPATVRRDAGAEAPVTVAFTERRPFALGFRSRYRWADERIAVPPTPAGVATALTYSGVAAGTTDPRRSHPSVRGVPPLIEPRESLDEAEVPRGIAAATPETGVELVAPASLSDLFVLAPLAYYLGAEVSVADRSTPLLRAPEAGVEHDLPAMPDLQRSASRLLRRSLLLDCLARAPASGRSPLAESSLLDPLGLDPAALAGATPAERLARTLSIPHEAVERRLPAWPCTLYVQPTPDNVAALPYILDRLALVALPSTSEFDGIELAKHSVDDFYRGPRPPDGETPIPPADAGANAPATRDWTRSLGTGDVASVDLVKPELRGGRVHGWLADEVPVDVFTATSTGVHNWRRHPDHHEAVDVAVVLNDEGMAAEVDVADVYRGCPAETVSVDIHRNCRRARLARVFESRHDFVHFVGHCERTGLCCPDGPLSTAELSRSRTETFFLNACGSYYEGRGLIDRGSVAGGVTVSSVMNDHAVTIGLTFARLLVAGFGMERAMGLARRRILMGNDYAVVGDGTHALTDRREGLPASAAVRRVEEGFLVSYEQFSTRHVGGSYRPPLGGDMRYLCGNPAEFVLDRSELLSFLQEHQLPVVFEDDLYWPGELSEELA